VFTVIVLVGSIYVDGQQSKLDSLSKAIKSTKADTSKIILYETLAQAYRDARKLDSSILAYQQALNLNRKINYSPLRQCYNMSTMDYLYYVTGNYTKSLEYASEALILSERLHDLPQMAHVHQQFGFNYMAFGNYREALTYFFKAKELFERCNHPEMDLESPAFAIVYIGYIYLKLNQPDSALLYVRKGYKLASTMSLRYVIDFALRIFGDIFLVKNNDQLALNYYRQYTNDFYKYNENNRDIGFVFNNMSKIFEKKGQMDSAILYAKKALANGKEYKDQENIYDAANALFNMHNKDSLNNQAEAFKYFKIAMAAKDSMASIEKIRQIQSLEFAEQTREKIQAEADAKALARTRLTITIIAILVSVVVFLIWNRLRQLRLRYKAILERKELEKLKTKHEKEMLELEAKALRAQMNPHFIFNCMNSIKLLIQQQEEDKAVSYLTTFSKLIRTIFQNSDKREITLHDEIQTCKLYTQLESMRFANKFNYSFSIDETIDLKLLMVPALIMQPFIENAIWHGIMPKEEGGCVNITIKGADENVLCIIDDDGIGRETSRHNKFKGEVHESKGVHLTQSRIDLDNLINQRNASLEIVDKKDEDSKASGTRVILTFKEY